MNKHPILTLAVLSTIGIALFAVTWKPQNKDVLAAQAVGRLQASPMAVQPQPTHSAPHEKYYFVEFFAGL